MTDLPRTGATPGGPGLLRTHDLSLFGILSTLLRRRVGIAGIFGVTVLVSLAYVLLKPRTYTTLFSFIPQTTQDPTKAGLAGLAGQFGVTLASGAAQPQSPQMYADLLQTRQVLGPIATDSFAVAGGGAARVPLAAALDAEDASPGITREKTLRYLRERVLSTSVATRTTGVVTVRVRTRSAVLSEQIATRLLSGLNHYNLVTRQSQAGEERRFIEGRLAAARTSLRTAEGQLEQFLKTNRQYTNSPELTFAQDRLQRDMLMQQQIVASLAQQYEDARIREVRDIPVVSVIERPIVAAQPDPRGGLLIMLGGAAIGLFLGIAWALLSEELARARVSPESAPELEHLSEEWHRVRRAQS